MNKLLSVLVLSTAVLAVQASAADTYVYSNQEYCELAQVTHTATERRYLQRYSERLGYTPSRQECHTLRTQVPANELIADSFDFQRELRVVHRGSVRRLPQTTVHQLTELPPEAQQHALQAFSDGRISPR